MKSSQTETANIRGQHKTVKMNRTGIMVNPEMSAELIAGAEKAAASTKTDGAEMTTRTSYQHPVFPIGSLPSMAHDEEKQSGPAAPMSVLLDKLGERLAFERQGTRVYEAFLKKLQALGADGSIGPTAEEVRHICDEELEHFKLLQKTISNMGGDATVQTPSADVAGVLSQGVLQVVSDPRTNLAQTLQALLTAELADNDGWEMLSDLAGKLGNTDIVEQCEKAFTEEQEHLENVRAWLSEVTMEEAVNENRGELSSKSAAGDSEKAERRTSRSSGARSTRTKKKRKK